MILFWDFYWPVIAAGLVIGVVTCWIALHGRTAHIYFEDEDKRPAHLRAKRWRIFGAGMLAAMFVGAMWHGPFGTADQFTELVEADARAELTRLEMTEVQVSAERGPLRRSLKIIGRTADFSGGRSAG